MVTGTQAKDTYLTLRKLLRESRWVYLSALQPLLSNTYLHTRNPQPPSSPLINTHRLQSWHPIRLDKWWTSSFRRHTRRQMKFGSRWVENILVHWRLKKCVWLYIIATSWTTQRLVLSAVLYYLFGIIWCKAGGNKWMMCCWCVNNEHMIFCIAFMYIFLTPATLTPSTHQLNAPYQQ